MNSKPRPENDVTLLSVPQVILLCILITVISSVATGIVVVQLVATAPGETVFQTIERVTETIVEKPVTSEQIPQTIVIKEGDLVAKAIAENNNSSLAMYTGDETTDVTLLGYGFVVGDDLVVSRPFPLPNNRVEAGMHELSTYGSAKITLWETTTAGNVFTGKESVEFTTGNPQVGQTAVYLSGDGSIIRGSINSVSNIGIEFSENLAGRDMGLIMDIGGEVIGLWTGAEIVRSESIKTQIQQLSTNQLQAVPMVIVEQQTPTNPEDVAPLDKKSACELIGGTFNEHSECEGINTDQCLVLGGEFNECGSACRHNPDAEICTAQCVIYCQL